MQGEFEQEVDSRQGSIEGEAAVLGSMILEPRCVGMLAASLPVEGFRRPENREIFEAIGETYLEHSDNLDIVLLRDTLKKRGKLEEIGGVDYLIEIVESTPSAANVEHYTRVVNDAYAERRLQKTIKDIESIAGDFLPLTERIQAIQEAVMSLELGDDVSSDLVSFSQHIGSVVDNIRDENDFIKTGIPPIDDRVLGFLPSELIVLAARPRQGKSALASQWAVSMARAGHGVLFVSLEMSPQSLMERILSSEASVDLHEYSKWHSEPDEQSLRSMGNDLARVGLNIIFTGTGCSTPESLAVAVRRLKKTRGIKVIFIDYLQLMSAGRKSIELRQMVTLISRKLKLLALAEDVVIIALSQLNREVESRTSHIPRLSDLRESGSIEQDADVVMLLNRPELYDGADADGKANLYIAKSRRGPGGVVAMDFAARYCRFGEVVGGML